MKRCFIYHTDYRLLVKVAATVISRCSSRGDGPYVVVPVYRASRMGVMSVRSEAEIAALKAKAQ